MLAKLGADARQQHGETEGLCDIVVGAGFQPQNRVGIGVMPGQHDDRRLEAALAQGAHHFAAIGVGQADIHQHQIGGIGLGGARALGAGIDRGGFEFFVQRQLLHQRIAQIGIVIHDQDLAGIGHGFILLGSGAARMQAAPSREWKFRSRVHYCCSS